MFERNYGDVGKMRYCLNKTRLIVSTIALSLVILLVACDRHMNSISDEVKTIDINNQLVERTSVESHAKRGIEISEEEHEEILSTISKEGLLDVTTTTT